MDGWLDFKARLQYVSQETFHVIKLDGRRSFCMTAKKTKAQEKTAQCDGCLQQQIRLLRLWKINISFSENNLKLETWVDLNNAAYDIMLNMQLAGAQIQLHEIKNKFSWRT